jgi:hypothetical protein
MTIYNMAFWTHANGADCGWFGKATHPAHLCTSGRLAPDTAWSINISGASLTACHDNLTTLADIKYLATHREGAQND